MHTLPEDPRVPFLPPEQVSQLAGAPTHCHRLLQLDEDKAVRMQQEHLYPALHCSVLVFYDIVPARRTVLVPSVVPSSGYAHHLSLLSVAGLLW